jgi:FkbM family methyltransferase
MNPRHTNRLKNLEKHYTLTCGHNVHFFTETAVSTYDGTIKFISDDDFSNEEWGATTNLDLNTDNTKNKQEVKSLDIAKFILTEIIPYADKIVVKMDIEGAEFNVLPKLIMNGVLCKMNKIFIEFHNSKYSENQKNIVNLATQLINHPEFFSIAGCPVQVSFIDDESYLHDADGSMNTC